MSDTSYPKIKRAYNQGWGHAVATCIAWFETYSYNFNKEMLVNDVNETRKKKLKVFLEKQRLPAKLPLTKEDIHDLREIILDMIERDELTLSVPPRQPSTPKITPQRVVRLYSISPEAEETVKATYEEFWPQIQKELEKAKNLSSPTTVIERDTDFSKAEGSDDSLRD